MRLRNVSLRLRNVSLRLRNVGLRQVPMCTGEGAAGNEFLILAVSMDFHMDFLIQNVGEKQSLSRY